MDKYIFLKEAIYILQPNVDIIIAQLTGNKKSTEDLLQVISKDTYNLKYDFSNFSGNLVGALFPGIDKEHWKQCKLCSIIAGILEFKWCAHCGSYKPWEDFAKNKSRKHGLNIYCRVCHISTTANTQASRQAKYKASKLQRTPPWVGLVEFEEITEFYSNCPKGYHVDHILPLQGKLVSGLHCIENLQYLTAEENKSKHNNYVIS